MKKIVILSVLLCAANIAKAGWFDADIKQAGKLVESYSVTAATDSTNLLWTQTPNAVNTDIFNNSAFTLWVGSNTATLQTTGFPVLSSTTYTVDGKFSGGIWGRIDVSAGGDENIRIIHYLMEPTE